MMLCVVSFSSSDMMIDVIRMSVDMVVVGLMLLVLFMFNMVMDVSMVFGLQRKIMVDMVVMVDMNKQCVYDRMVGRYIGSVMCQYVCSVDILSEVDIVLNIGLSCFSDVMDVRCVVVV